MKRRLIILAIVVAIGFTGWQIVNSQDAASPVDESQIIVAQYEWNGLHQISLAELNAAIAQLPIYRQRNYESQTGKAEYLEQFINDKLKLLAATEAGFDKDEELLKKAEEYKHQLMVERLTELEVDQKINYTDEDLKGYYEAHKADYVEAARSRATCITMTDEKRAQEVLAQIKAGKDIKEMAKELWDKKELARGPGYNEDDPGNTFPFTRDASARWQEFIDAVFDQKVGEMTQEVFEIDVNDQTYYMIFRKEEAIPERQKPFDEVKDKVEKAVEREKKRERIAEWVKAVREEGQLQTYPDRIPAPPPEENTDTKKSGEE